jgi:hypothetical protein
MKKMKKFVCGEVCALAFARVGVQRELVDGHRVIGNEVAKFVELVNSPPARGGGVRHQEMVARQVFDEGNLGTQADFCWCQTSRANSSFLMMSSVVDSP